MISYVKFYLELEHDNFTFGISFCEICVSHIFLHVVKLVVLM